MIPAKVLRIGNKFLSAFGNVETVLSIMDNTDNGKIKVLTPAEYAAGDQIGFASEAHRLQYSHLILCEENGNQYKPLEINGVPLTEEILLSVGFEQGDIIERSYRGKYACLIKENVLGKFFYEENCFEYIVHGKQTQYKFLHEIQNLYFALEQTELEIK